MQLPNESRAPGAEREAHRDLALARRRAREQQVGDVRAGDEQHDADDRHQDVQRLAGTGA